MSEIRKKEIGARLGRPKSANPKQHFTCQLRKTLVVWLKTEAKRRAMSNNALVELALLHLQSQFLAQDIATNKTEIEEGDFVPRE